MKTELLDNPQTTYSPDSGPYRTRRNKWARRAALVCLLAVLTGPVLPLLARGVDVGGKKTITIYQGNGYVGGLIEAPLALDPNDPNYQSNLLVTVAGVYQQIVAANPAARMAALAEEIAAQRPDVAGLEELYTVELAPDIGMAPGQFSIVFDYVQLLTDALTAKGAHYKVVVLSTESDVTMPMAASVEPFTVAWGRIIDHEAILVRTDLPPGYLQASNPRTGRFSIYPQIPFGTQTLSIYHGWCSVDVFTRGERFRVICSHPQDESLPDVEKAELMELLNDVANANMPVMVIGDLNTDPFGRNGTDSYGVVATAGFKDTWAVLHPDNLTGGLTFGHDPGLSEPALPFAWRLDYVLYRGNQFTPVAIESLDPKVGAEPPLWPSDHATITATFFLGNEEAFKGTPSRR